MSRAASIVLTEILFSRRILIERICALRVLFCCDPMRGSSSKRRHSSSGQTESPRSLSTARCSKAARGGYVSGNGSSVRPFFGTPLKSDLGKVRFHFLIKKLDLRSGYHQPENDGDRDEGRNSKCAPVPENT